MALWLRRTSPVGTRKIILEQLEDRIVLDAAIDATPKENPADQVATSDENAGGMDSQGGEAGGGPALPTSGGGSASGEGPAQEASLAAIFNVDLQKVLITSQVGQIEAVSSTPESAPQGNASALIAGAAKTLSVKLGDPTGGPDGTILPGPISNSSDTETTASSEGLILSGHSLAPDGKSALRLTSFSGLSRPVSFLDLIPDQNSFSQSDLESLRQEKTGETQITRLGTVDLVKDPVAEADTNSARNSDDFTTVGEADPYIKARIDSQENGVTKSDSGHEKHEPQDHALADHEDNAALPVNIHDRHAANPVHDQDTPVVRAVVSNYTKPGEKATVFPSLEVEVFQSLAAVSENPAGDGHGKSFDTFKVVGDSLPTVASAVGSERSGTDSGIQFFDMEDPNSLSILMGTFGGKGQTHHNEATGDLFGSIGVLPATDAGTNSIGPLDESSLKEILAYSAEGLIVARLVDKVAPPTRGENANSDDKEMKRERTKPGDESLSGCGQAVLHDDEGLPIWLALGTGALLDKERNIERTERREREVVWYRLDRGESYENLERLRLLAKHSLTGMFILQDGLFVYVNDRLAEIIGCLPEDLLGDGFWKFIHPEDQDLFRRDTMASLQKGPGPAGYELRVSRGNGEARWVEVLTTEVEYRGRLARIGNVIDITDRKHSEALAAEQTAELRRLIEQLQHLANIDGLTRVFNRRRFDEYLDREWGRLRREQKPLSLILCDVDHFKLYNDAYGHQAGDDCLRAIAKVLNLNAKRPADLVARYGGEEFGVILPDTDAEGALQVAEAIRREVLQLKIDHVGSCINDYVTVSLGVSAVVPTRRVSPNALVQLADAALYEAKNKGRDRVILKTADSVHSVTMGITPELRAG